MKYVHKSQKGVKRGPPWSRSACALLRRWHNRKTYKEIAALLSPERTWFSVRNKARELQLTGGSNLGRKYSADQEFFSVLSSENSYWGGFLAADGCVSGNRLSVGLSSKDRKHLDLLRRSLGYTGPLYDRPTVSTLMVHCPSLAKDLRRHFSITPRKSLTLRPPHIRSQSHVRAFIQGLIDGDGSVYKVTGRKDVWRIVVYGTKAVCSWVRRWFDRFAHSPGDYKPAAVRKIQRHLHCYAISGRRVSSACQLFLSMSVPRLRRKWGPLLRMKEST